MRNFCYGISSFIGWTLTSFLCHHLAKLFLKRSATENNLGKDFLWAGVITSSQLLMCFLLTDVHLFDKRSSNAQYVLRVKVICHVLATMATNYSMTLVHASSTFAIKLLEPITSAVVQRIVLGTSMSPSAIFSLPVIIGGSVTFCGGTITTSSSLLGIVVALASNVILAFRNVAIKLEQSDSSMKSVQLRPKYTIIVILSLCLLLIGSTKYLSVRELMSDFASFLVITAAMSSVFHVAYSFISTNVVLIYMSVVSHSVANIFKRVLVVLLLSATGHRQMNLISISGLVICVLGLLLYVLSQKGKTADLWNTFLKSCASHHWKTVLYIVIICVAMSLLTFRPSSTVAKNSTLETVLTYNIRKCSDRVNAVTDQRFAGKTFRGGSFLSYISNFNVSYKSLPKGEKVQKFLKRQLISSPTATDVLSKLLTSVDDVIKEAQRIHFNLFSSLLKNYKYAILLDVAAFENKGDPAITVGEVYLLRRLGIQLLYYCNYYACNDKTLSHASSICKKYSIKDVIVLIHGGGNIIGYKENDYLRKKIFKHFPHHNMILFPQSIFLRNTTAGHFEFCQKMYKSRGNFTMILRDRQSLKHANRYLKGNATFMMAPDMAFQIGRVPRFLSPSFDILWIKRTDKESPGYKVPAVPKGITLHSADWWKWLTPKGKTTMETAFMIANNGFIYLQRGRVVITDRLHGHILCILLDIPHVLIDNKYKKLEAYYTTWTHSLPIVRMAHNSTHAVELALQLLEDYKEVLPPIAPFMDIVEVPK